MPTPIAAFPPVSLSASLAPPTGERPYKIAAALAALLVLLTAAF